MHRNQLLLTSSVLVITISLVGCGTADPMASSETIAEASLALSNGIYDFPNSEILAEAKSRSGFGDQCKVFAEKVVNAVLAREGESARILGYNHGGAYYAVYKNAGGILVPFEETQPGDLIQSIQAFEKDEDTLSSKLGLHTAIAMAAPQSNGDIKVIDSNWVDHETIGTHVWHTKLWKSKTGATLYVWRFGSVAPEPPPPPPIPSTPYEGMLVAQNGEVYVVAGGAPLYVSSLSRVNSGQVFNVSASYFDRLKDVPADGTIISGSPSGEVYVLVGGAPVYVANWANIGGSQGKTVVKVDDVAIQHAGESGRYSHLNRVPEDGSYLRGGTSGEIYVLAGGAPQYITNWANIGGPPSDPIPTIDDSAIARAGGPPPYHHLNPVPADGTLIRGGTETYVTVGGAPEYVTSWDNLGGALDRDVTLIDQVTLDGAGGKDRYGHLRQFPADGTFLQGGVGGEAYVVAGGAPLYVSAWANVNKPSGPVTTIDDVTIAAAGGTARYGHFRKTPNDGTLIVGTTTNEVYVIAGGAPVYVSDWAHVGGQAGKSLTFVDAVAIAGAGGSERYGHLNSLPANGTFIRDESGTIYRVEGGAPIYVSTWRAFNPQGTPSEVVGVDSVSVANGGASAGRYSHLRFFPLDGTQLTGSGGGRYTVQSGAALPYPGSDTFPATTLVDQAAIDRAGGTGPYAHLK